MATADRTFLSDLPKGHRFPDAGFRLTAEDVSRYLDAVQDANALYLDRGLVPPLAVVAHALGVLLKVVELPAGTLHTGQEVEARGSVPVGAALTLAGRIAQRSERAGLIISVIEFEVAPSGAEAPVVTGRMTAMAPLSTSARGAM